MGSKREGPCPRMRSCGGCTWLNLPYRKQLHRKRLALAELVIPLLDRYGWDVTVGPVLGMGGTADSKDLPAPRQFRYKAATPFAPGAHGSVACGFFATGTHRIIPIEDCCAEAPGARRILNGVAAAASELRIPAYDEDRHRGILRYAVLRLGWKRPEGILTLVASTPDVPRLQQLVERVRALDSRITCVALNINGRATNAILGRETRVLWGAAAMHDELLGCTFAISPTAFYQTNPAQTEVLYRTAIEQMDLQAGDVLLDAYCGSGTIGLCAAHAAREQSVEVRLLGVERNPAGIADARRNARLNGLEDRSEFVAEDATAYLRRAAQAGERVDVLVMDPPRAGSTPAFLQAAARLRPRRIVYVSCNPATQMRDIDVLAQEGYRLKTLVGVDMFPHTEHIETVCLLVPQG